MGTSTFRTSLTGPRCSSFTPTIPGILIEVVSDCPTEQKNRLKEAFRNKNIESLNAYLKEEGNPNALIQMLNTTRAISLLAASINIGCEPFVSSLLNARGITVDSGSREAILTKAIYEHLRENLPSQSKCSIQ